MNENPTSRSPDVETARPPGDIETALADLRWALEEDDVVEKHYHVRSAMQRLQLRLERAERTDSP